MTIINGPVITPIPMSNPGLSQIPGLSTPLLNGTILQPMPVGALTTGICDSHFIFFFILTC